MVYFYHKYNIQTLSHNQTVLFHWYVSTFPMLFHSTTDHRLEASFPIFLHHELLHTHQGTEHYRRGHSRAVHKHTGSSLRYVSWPCATMALSAECGRSSWHGTARPDRGKYAGSPTIFNHTAVISCTKDYVYFFLNQTFCLIFRLIYDLLCLVQSTSKI